MISHSILIVDDDLDLLMLLERELQQQGYIIETAASLPEAADILEGFRPDLVLLDINVNGEDGRQLCWKIKSHQSSQHIKVIIMSGYDVNATRSILFRADDFVVKPFNTEFLLMKIRYALKQAVSNTFSLVPPVNFPDPSSG